MQNFIDICANVRTKFYSDWGCGENTKVVIELIKRAVLGSEKEINFFVDRIKSILAEIDSLDETTTPSWYKNIPVAEAIYHEIWGWGPVAEWFTSDYADSPRFFIEGENCFVERDGHQKLMVQRITPTQKDRLIKVLSSGNNDAMIKSIDMTNGTSVAITFDNDIVLTRPTPSLVTKQDIAVELWSRLSDKEVGVALDTNCIESCNMRKINSFGITLKDGRKFKVVVKDSMEDDQND